MRFFEASKGPNVKCADLIYTPPASDRMLGHFLGNYLKAIQIVSGYAVSRPRPWVSMRTEPSHDRYRHTFNFRDFQFAPNRPKVIRLVLLGAEIMP
jgi:hypothetical protein